MGSRRPALVVALGVLVTLGAGASVSSTAAPSGGTLRIVLPPAAIPVLDPATIGRPLGWGAVWYSTCATLMAFRDAEAPAGYELRPEAAAGFPTISRDRRTYVFTVRRGLRFSDGSSLSAGNFEKALNRVRDPEMLAPVSAELFSDVKRVWSSGRRLRIELSNPGGDLPMRLALPYACPVPLGFPVDPAGVPLTVSSGPYVITREEPSRVLVLERNRYYRGSRPRRVDRIVLTVGGDNEDSVRAVDEGQTDVYGGALPFELQEGLVRRYGVNRRQLFRIRGTVVYHLALNTSRPLFRRNVALRKAVNLALDRVGLVKLSWPLSHRPTDQIVPSWPPGWVDHHLYPLAGNLRRAKSLAAGNLGDGKAVLYVSQPPPFLVDQANAIARQLRQIGLEVTVTPLAPRVLDTRAGTRGAPYDMALMRYFVEYPDPARVIIRHLAGENARAPAGNTNLAYFDSARYNRRLAAANRLVGTERRRAFSRLDSSIMRYAAPWAPLYEGSEWLFVSKRVGCVKPHPVYRLDLTAICLR